MYFCVISRTKTDENVRYNQNLPSSLHVYDLLMNSLNQHLSKAHQQHTLYGAISSVLPSW